MRFSLSLFIFRRDLRLPDNTALIAALEESKEVIPCFIYDPRQISALNDYRGLNSMQFMQESLVDLDEQLKLHNTRLFHFCGAAEEVVEQLLRKHPIEAVFINEDYTPFAQQRDTKIENVCISLKREFCSYADALLHAPQDVLKPDGNFYTKFTPYYKRARELFVPAPRQLPKQAAFFNGNLSDTLKKKPKEFVDFNEELYLHGGRGPALRILKNIQQWQHYAKTHDIPSQPTTGLSPYHKFGCISIRESYSAVSKKLGQLHELNRQFFWRDFFTQIAFHAPHVFGHAYHKKFDRLRWKNNHAQFKRWCEGTTGFPIVDAGMRQLNKTGFMHNRVRMVVASFLVKDLHIDWRWGEKYFAQHLIDYDPAVNNGNWQWVASTGCDAQPYFRIFNPWLQQKKFDPDCVYIKQWVPELKNVNARDVHRWDKAHEKIKSDYCAPIAEHQKEALLVKQWFKTVG